MAWQKLAALAAMLLALAPLEAQAHHAIAMYDPADPMRLDGTVKKFDWGNPHSWLTVTVAEGGDWLVECNSVALLQRSGWTRTSVKPGDRITLTIAPHIDGIRRGEAIEVITASGAHLANAMVEP